MIKPRVKINNRNLKQKTMASNMMPWRSLNRLTNLLKTESGTLVHARKLSYAGRHIDGLDTIDFSARLNNVVKDDPCSSRTARCRSDNC